MVYIAIVAFGESSSGGAVIGNTFYVVGGYDDSGLTGRLQAYSVPEPNSLVLISLESAAY